MRLEYFDMVDSIEAMDLEAGTIRTIALTPDQSPVFIGHFPGFPVLPGVMMLEAMNHAAGLLVYWRLQKTRFVFLGGIKRAKFRRFVKPGTKLIAEAELIHDGSGFCVLNATLAAAGEIVADAEIVLIAGDFPNPEVKAAIEQRSEAIRATMAESR